MSEENSCIFILTCNWWRASLLLAPPRRRSTERERRRRDVRRRRAAAALEKSEQRVAGPSQVDVDRLSRSTLSLCSSALGPAKAAVAVACARVNTAVKTQERKAHSHAF